jgi:hypothetical protein
LEKVERGDGGIDGEQNIKWERGIRLPNFRDFFTIEFFVPRF